MIYNIIIYLSIIYGFRIYRICFWIMCFCCIISDNNPFGGINLLCGCVQINETPRCPICCTCGKDSLRDYTESKCTCLACLSRIFSPPQPNDPCQSRDSNPCIECVGTLIVCGPTIGFGLTEYFCTLMFYYIGIAGTGVYNYCKNPCNEYWHSCKDLCNYKNITRLCITDHPTAQPTAQPTAVVPVYRYHLSHLQHRLSTTVVVGDLIKQLPTEQRVPTDDYDSDDFSDFE